MRRLTSLLTAGIVTAGMLVTGATAAAAAPAHDRAAAARAALIKYLGHHHSTAIRAPGGAAGDEYYYNWSGYADSSTTANYFTKVTGKWLQPAVGCTNEDQMAATWVGLDGNTNNTVEQDGTLAWCFEGTAYYYTWWEMYPTNNIQTVGQAVAPGDAITSTVIRQGTKYILTVTDATNTANSFKTTQTCSLSTCVDESAEWIAERPSTTTGLLPLADYHTWTVTAASAAGGGQKGSISTFSDDEIWMVDSTDSYYLSTPSALTHLGHSFTTTWDNSY
jgi:hypothetical protein